VVILVFLQVFLYRILLYFLRYFHIEFCWWSAAPASWAVSCLTVASIYVFLCCFVTCVELLRVTV